MFHLTSATRIANMELHKNKDLHLEDLLANLQAAPRFYRPILLLFQIV